MNWSNAAGSKSVSRCHGVFDVSGPLGFVADHGEGVVVGSQARSERQDKTAAALHIDHGVTSVGDATLWNDTLTFSTCCVFICLELQDASGSSQIFGLRCHVLSLVVRRISERGWKQAYPWCAEKAYLCLVTLVPVLRSFHRH